jgi:tRNA A-37 threonylcarbamoyl transferase component Bud32
VSYTVRKIYGVIEAFMSSETIVYTENQIHATETYTRIRNHNWVILGQVVWFVALLITLWRIADNLITFLNTSQEVCMSQCLPFALTPVIANQLTAANLPLNFWGIHIVILDMLLSVMFVGVSAFIFIRKSDDWLALLTSGMLMMIVANIIISNTASVTFTAFGNVIVQTHNVIAIYLILKFTSVFPNGKYVPSWGWVVVYVGLGWELFRRVFVPPITSANGFRIDVLLIIFAIIGLSLLTQVYRFRYVSTPAQRQQTKWVILGGALSLVGITISTSLYFIVLPSNDSLAFNLALRGLYYLALICLPFGLAFSVLRYRIWEADLAINRSVVYGLMSVLLILIFVATFFIIQQVVLRALGQQMDLLATGIALVVIIVAFNPIRLWARHFVDVNFFGFRQDLNQLAQQQAKKAIISNLPLEKIEGQKIQEYEVIQLIAKGGMGRVYKAFSNQTEGVIALKVMSEMLLNDDIQKARFEREAEVAKNLKHPLVVPVLSYGTYDNTVYLTMPYIQGTDLSDLLRQRTRFSQAELKAILSDMADAIDYVHSQGLVHRDIKPSNFIFTTQNRTMLTDFGIAKVKEGSKLTQSGVIGTIDYSAPEQIISSKEVDYRADLYSFGVTTYHLLTGETPFHGNIGNVVFSHLNQPAPNAHEICNDVPEFTALTLQRMMAKNPQDRFANAKEFVEYIYS